MLFLLLQQQSTMNTVSEMKPITPESPSGASMDSPIMSRTSTPDSQKRSHTNSVNSGISSPSPTIMTHFKEV